jgi:hypothetical protein
MLVYENTKYTSYLAGGENAPAIRRGDRACP